MAPVGTLWGSLKQPLTRTVLSVAALNDLELEQPKWEFMNKPTAFTSKFPYGKVPAFEGTDGFKLIEGITIARHLCRLGTKVHLLGTETNEIALIDQWIHFAESEIGVPTFNMMGLIYGFSGSFNRETLDNDAVRLHRALAFVESHLAASPSGYLVSSSLTLADLVLAGMVFGASYGALGAAERAKYPSVFANYAIVSEDARMKHLWGTETFAEVAATEPRPLPPA